MNKAHKIAFNGIKSDYINKKINITPFAFNAKVLRTVSTKQ